MTHSFYDAGFFSVETVIYPSMFLMSSLLLGSVTVGMLIGHWYLIDTGQSLEPFIRIYKFFVFALIGQCIFFVIGPLALYLLGSPQSQAELFKLWQSPFDSTDDSGDRRPDRAADFVVDDLAHAPYPAHHGGHGAFLYCPAGSFCRRNSRATNFGANNPAVLNRRAA